MKISKALRGNRDLPQLETYITAAVAAGTGADYEHVLTALPNLAVGAPAGNSDFVADNTMRVRAFYAVWEAAITGAATNNFVIQLNQRRGGNLLVNTTSSTAVSAAGPATITVGASGAVNCYVGQVLAISGGTGTAENIVVSAYNPVANTITANFANTHSGTYNVVSAPLASLTYASGVNDSAYAVRQFTPINANYIKAGDVLTVSRVSNGTGLAQPAGKFFVDWVNTGS